MKKILIFFLLLAFFFSGFSQHKTITERWQSIWETGNNARSRAQSIDSSFADVFDTIAVVRSEIGTDGITRDSLNLWAITDMYVRLNITEPATINTKLNARYYYDISENDTIDIVDDLGYNYAYGTTTTEAITVIEWQNDDNTSELFLKYSGSVISFVSGSADLTKRNIIVIQRSPLDGMSLDQILSITYNGTYAKRTAPTPPTAPAISSATMEASNAYLDVIFDKNVYGANDGAAPIALSDFTITFTQGAGAATNWVVDSIRTTSGTPITTGISTARFYATTTGTADGNETVEITAVDGASVYEITGIAMSETETTGAIALESLTFSDPSDYNPEYWRESLISYNGVDEYTDAGNLSSVLNATNYDILLVVTINSNIETGIKYLMGVRNSNTVNQFGVYTLGTGEFVIKHASSTGIITFPITASGAVWQIGVTPIYKIIHIRKTGFDLVLKVDDVPITMTPSSITEESALSSISLYLSALNDNLTPSFFGDFSQAGVFVKEGNLNPTELLNVYNYLDAIKGGL